MLPASVFEKWLSMVFVQFILFGILYFTFFALVDTILYDYVSASSETWGSKLFLTDVVKPTFSFVLFYASWILVFSTYLKKNEVIISLITFILFIVSIFWIDLAISNPLFDTRIAFFDILPFIKKEINVPVEEGTTRILLNHTENSSDLSVNYIYPFFTVVLLIIYYFRLKETEI